MTERYSKMGSVARMNIPHPVWMLILWMMCLPCWAANGTLLPKSSGYPRLVRLIHGPTATNGWIIAGTTRVLFESKDDGKTFSFLSNAPARTGSKLRCCATLYELPRSVGSLSAGTLLYAATYSLENIPKSLLPEIAAPSANPRRRFVPAIEVYTSSDQGRHWTYHSTPVMGYGEKGTGGLWEPEFSVARDGSLVMFWSDETYSCCSQKLMKIRTSDGVTWRDASDVVATTDPADRPGMIIVSHLPTGLYFMTYEKCGNPITGHKCAAYYRTSRDGWNYGPAWYPGTRIEDAEGQYFEHAPANIWSLSPLSPNGAIVVVGQVLHSADNSVAQQNGRVLFVNALLDGSGPWHKIQAPVEVPNSYDNPCPNYSSALLPVEDGRALLELATDYYELKECGAYFDVKTWTEMMPRKSTKAP